MASIINPSVALLLYDWRDRLGQSPEDLEENRAQFAQKLPVNIPSTVLNNDQPFESEFIELLGEAQQIEALSLDSEELEGYAYPVRLSDTYGLLLNCSVRNRTINYSLETINDLKNSLDKNLNHQIANIGQTWIISGQLPTIPYNRQNVERLAQECYKSIFPQGNWEEDFQGQGEFIEGKIFELWRYRLAIVEQPNEEGSEPILTANIEENDHIIIAIYPNAEIAKSASYFLADWMRIFNYRSKVIWAYSQSRLLRKLLYTDYSKIQQYTRDLQLNSWRFKELELVNEAKELFSNYAVDINDLAYQRYLIETNLENYCQGVKKLQYTLRRDAVSQNLDFLNNFAVDAQNKYLQQVNQDYDNLSPGLGLLESSVQLIRTEGSLKQNRSDRYLQQTIFIAATGITTGTSVATISNHFPTVTQQDAETEHPIGSLLSFVGIPEPWIVPGISTVLSLSAAIVGAGITALCIKAWERS